jgi:heme/copper-type cytochrome/quinol oxidase subunit 3
MKMKPASVAIFLLFFCALFCLSVFGVLYVSTLGLDTARALLRDVSERPCYAIGFGVGPLLLGGIAVTAASIALSTARRALGRRITALGFGLAIVVVIWEYADCGSIAPLIAAAAIFGLSWYLFLASRQKPGDT